MVFIQILPAYGWVNLKNTGSHSAGMGKQFQPSLLLNPNWNSKKAEDGWALGLAYHFLNHFIIFYHFMFFIWLFFIILSFLIILSFFIIFRPAPAPSGFTRRSTRIFCQSYQLTRITPPIGPLAPQCCWPRLAQVLSWLGLCCCLVAFSFVCPSLLRL